MNRRTLASAIGGVLLLASSTLLAADKPNFTGEWKLNIDKSTFGPMPPPTSQTMKIEHADPNVVAITEQDGADGKTTITVKYKTDGTETANEIRGQQAKSTGKWDGDSLTVTTKLDFQGMEIILNNAMKLSTDGKTMNAATKIVTPQGEFETAYLYEKVK